MSGIHQSVANLPSDKDDGLKNGKVKESANLNEVPAGLSSVELTA
jgi:hypothetical protein